MRSPEERGCLKMRTNTSSVKASNEMNQSVIVSKSILRSKYLYLILFPIIVYFVVFKYVPMYGIIIAFKDFRFADGILGSQWVGMKHFVRLFSSPDFFTILRNTLLLSLYSIVFSFPVPIILAILLNEVRNIYFKKTLQSILYVPYFISWVVLGGIVIAMLSPSTGIVNIMLGKLGIQPIYFLKSTFWWPVVYIASEIWQTAGWGTIIYLASITSVDIQLYEAAIVDGASKWRQIWHITLPCIRGTIAIMLILRMGRVLDIGFEQVYMLQNDAVRAISEVISTYEYRIGLQGAQYSYTTALSLFKGVIGLILITLTNKIVKSLGEDGLW